MKSQFPFFKNNLDIHYFDSAATTFKPQIVIDALTFAYARYTIPIEKGLYNHAQKLYDELLFPLENKIKFLFNANEYKIFFGHSVTILLDKIIDLIMNNLLDKNKIISILCPEFVHNSFFIPLQKYSQVKLYFYPSYSSIECFLDISIIFDIIYFPIINHVNGEEIDYSIFEAYKKKHNTIIIADASQSGMYQRSQLHSNLIDFFLLASHKMYGPEGLAIVMMSNEFMEYYKKFFLTISYFFLKKFFAQGSLPYTAYYGFLITLNFLESNVYFNNNYKKKQKDMINNLYDIIKLNNNLRLISHNETKTILSFYHNNTHANDLGQIFSLQNVCLRTGDLCTSFKIKNNNKGIVRISFGCYNNYDDINMIKKLINII